MGDRFLELSENMVDRERTDAARRASAELTQNGRSSCLDCGCQIEAERIAAAPFAQRCIECQRAHEHDRNQRKHCRTAGLFDDTKPRNGKVKKHVVSRAV